MKIKLHRSFLKMFSNFPHFRWHRWRPIEWSIIIQRKCWHFAIICYKLAPVNVIKRQAILDFSLKHNDARIPFETWFAVCKKSQWSDYHDLQLDFPEAFPVGDNRVVFDIKGNRYRVVARVLFLFKQVQIKWIGTHAEYNRIDVTTVNKY